MDYSSRTSIPPGESTQYPVEASWARCHSQGLQCEQTPGFGTCQPNELERLQAQNADLLRATEDEALPYFDTMLQNTQCLIVFADPGGTILKTLYPKAQTPAVFEGLRPGNIWDEDSAGTNAIGTSLATGKAVHVRGGQHYLKAHHHLSGSATPVFDARGDLAGVINLSGTIQMPGDYTLGMVKLLSHGIENRLIFRTYQADFHILKFNTSASSLDSNWAGLLVVDARGEIRAANRRARTLLGNTPAKSNLRQLFSLSLDELTSAATEAPAQLKASGNYQILAQVIPPEITHTARRTPRVQNRGGSDIGPSATIPADVIRPEELEHGDDRVRRLVTQARKMMEKDIPIVVSGETGSGKEILVRSLHYHSGRAQGPLIAVNCAAIPAELAESQLFGYEKGAFTGAHNKGYAGLIRQADGGTLFLDEIGEMPLMLQSRLLRVLQQREVTPLGSTESYPVDIKLISATNRSLQEDIARGHFRQDLYYRVAGLNVELPALRERADIKALIRFVHQRLLETEPGPALSDGMLERLARHRWPGNLRQLVHVLRVGMAMADGDSLAADHLPDDFITDTAGPVRAPTEPLAERLARLYRANGGNVSRTARAAGVSRNTAYKYLRWSDSR